MKSQSEKEITKAIRGLLKTIGIFHWKVHQGLGCLPGIPDILGIYKGRTLGIEVKTAKGKVSEHQQRFIDTINREGGIAFVARSPDDVIKSLGLQDRFLFNRVSTGGHSPPVITSGRPFTGFIGE